jgi:signal peptidase I
MHRCQGVASLLVAVASLQVMGCSSPHVYEVGSLSMFPTLQPRDVVLVRRASEYQRGDIVCFVNPHGAGVFVMRITGLPNETIRVTNTTIRTAERSYTLESIGIPAQDYGGLTQGIYGVKCPVALGRGSYFVLGDNLNAAKDSRYWGELPEEAIIGKVRKTWKQRGE